MKILAIDTSAKTASAALLSDGMLIGSFTVTCGLTHSQTMLSMTDALLTTCDTKASDISLFACCAGPGSFTGVRIGVSLVKGLAFGRDVPCAPVSSLDMMAYAFRGLSDSAVVSPVMDARRGTLYNALYSLENGVLKRLTPDRVISEQDLIGELDTLYAGRKVYFPGDGEYLIDAGKKAALPQTLILPGAYGAALRAEEMLSENLCVSSGDLMPVYLRPARADIPKSLRT